MLQQAVDVAAQEIARMPFEPNRPLGLTLFDQCASGPFSVAHQNVFREQIYEETHLVILETAYDASTPFQGDLQAYVATLPLLNRLLVPVMVPDRVEDPDSGNVVNALRYPGALVRTASDDYTVLIPRVAYNYQGVVDGYQCSGETLVEWLAPVEEIRADHDQDPSTPDLGPYTLEFDSGSPPSLPSFSPGVVALRINYPTQSTTLLNRTDVPNQGVPNQFRKRGQVLVAANDSLLSEGDTRCYTLVKPAGSAGNFADPHGGRYGLGSLPVLKGQVRPFRKVMSFQAIYRREVYR